MSMFSRQNGQGGALVPGKSAAGKKPLPPSVIGPGTHILGNMISDAVIDFEGVIDGNIKCQNLTIRAGGVVRGEIVADVVSIYGKVRGLVRARSVNLYASCHVEGIVMHEALSIEDGAFLDGKCKRTNKIYTNDNEGNHDYEAILDVEFTPDGGTGQIGGQMGGQMGGTMHGDSKMLENLRLIG